MNRLKRVALALTGASGIIYGVRLAEALEQHVNTLYLIYTRGALEVARYELGVLEEDLRKMLGKHGVVYREDDYSSPLASSSNAPEAMVIAPCSMKTLASIAYGFQNNLVVRSSLNVLRLGRRLILVPRETPLGVVELEAMLRVAKAGAIVLPASPAFYHKPSRITDLVDFIVGKVLDVLGIEHKLYVRWSPKTSI